MINVIFLERLEKFLDDEIKILKKTDVCSYRLLSFYKQLFADVLIEKSFFCFSSKNMGE